MDRKKAPNKNHTKWSAMTLTFELEFWFMVTANPLPTGNFLVNYEQD